MELDSKMVRLLAILGTAVVGGSLVGCDDGVDSAEDVGEQIDDAADDAGDAIEDAADDIEDAVDEP